MKILPSNNSFIGIDIGSTGIKIVELKKEKNQLRLVNYGFSEEGHHKSVEQLEDLSELVDIIKQVLIKADIKTVDGFAALPAFSVFTSVINLPSVSESDMASAVHWEAKKVIPLPLDDMILDWKRIDESEDANAKNTKVLLTGAPKALVQKYVSIFKETGVHLRSMETETFSLLRSLLGNDKSTAMIVEIGAGTTDVAIVDKGIPMLSRSIGVGGDTINKKLSERLNIDESKAEQFKYDLGLIPQEDGDDSVKKIIAEALSPVINEIKYSMELYHNKSGKKTEKIILSGGSALLPDLAEYLAKVLDRRVSIGNPWERVSYQVDLKPVLEEIGPRMSVAVGLAMYGFGH